MSGATPEPLHGAAHGRATAVFDGDLSNGFGRSEPVGRTVAIMTESLAPGLRAARPGAAAAAAPSTTAPPPVSHTAVRSTAGSTGGPTPRWWRDTSLTAAWLVNLFVVALWVARGEPAQLSSLAGFLDATGRLAGMLGSSLLLCQVFLMARVPWVERAWGQDELTRIHRLVGFTSFNLIVAHVVLITLGYAADSQRRLWGTVADLVLDYPGMLLAVAGTAALCLVVVTSLRAARRRLRYESWHLVHLYGYLGAGLALPHQLWTGSDFLTSRTATVFWWGLYAGCAAAVLVYRVARPAWNAWRHPLWVSDVRDEGPSATSVTVSGPGVARLGARGGQFFLWRFVDGPGWTRANPYSLSARPTAQSMTFTAARVGDGSGRLPTLRPGTRVFVEGPFGRMHAGARTRRKALLLGAGIGVTPLKALLEDLPAEPGDVTLVHRVSRREDLVLADEIDALARERGARYLLAEGHRVPDRTSWLPQWAAHLTDDEGLRQVCPDVTERDIYVCGPPPWIDAVIDAARAAGVPAGQIHAERFQY